MSSGDWLYIGQSINPIGGLLVSVPWAILKMRYPLWIVLASAPLLAYVQVMVADVLWTQLQRTRYIQALLQKRDARIDKLLASGGAFVPVMLATPLVGAWVVMVAMRYAQIPQRRVAAPILLSLLLLTVVISVLCLAVPTLFS